MPIFHCYGGGFNRYFYWGFQNPRWVVFLDTDYKINPPPTSPTTDSTPLHSKSHPNPLSTPYPHPNTPNKNLPIFHLSTSLIPISPHPQPFPTQKPFSSTRPFLPTTQQNPTFHPQTLHSPFQTTTNKNHLTRILSPKIPEYLPLSRPKSSSQYTFIPNPLPMSKTPSRGHFLTTPDPPPHSLVPSPIPKNYFLRVSIAKPKE